MDGVDASQLWTPKKENSSLWANVSTSFADASWGDWRRECFHLLGVDVLLTEDGAAHLLEINCNPSLGIDAVHVTEGEAATANESAWWPGGFSLRSIHHLSRSRVPSALPPLATTPMLLAQRGVAALSPCRMAHALQARMPAHRRRPIRTWNGSLR